MTGCAYLHETRSQRLTDHAAVSLDLAVDVPNRLPVNDVSATDNLSLF